MYQYVLVEVPTKPVSPSERLILTWEARQSSETSLNFSDIQLCVGLFGPWESVEALKRAASPGRPSCPPSGAVATSETLRTTTHSGARMATALILPAAPGFYDLRQVSIFDAGNSTSTGSIIEVR
jgi:hypothetical protein